MCVQQEQRHETWIIIEDERERAILGIKDTGNEREGNITYAGLFRDRDFDGWLGSFHPRCTFSSSYSWATHLSRSFVLFSLLERILSVSHFKHTLFSSESRLFFSLSRLVLILYFFLPSFFLPSLLPVVRYPSFATASFLSFFLPHFSLSLLLKHPFPDVREWLNNFLLHRRLWSLFNSLVSFSCLLLFSYSCLLSPHEITLLDKDVVCSRDSSALLLMLISCVVLCIQRRIVFSETPATEWILTINSHPTWCQTTPFSCLMTTTNFCFSSRRLSWKEMYCHESKCCRHKDIRTDSLVLWREKLGPNEIILPLSLLLTFLQVLHERI